MAQSPDKLFRIDPREVKAVAPVSEFTAQTNVTGGIDTRLALRSRQRGSQQLGQAILNLGVVKANQRLDEDIRTAEEAASREEVMPGGLLPKAQRAYRDAIDINTFHAASLEAENYLEGEFSETLRNTQLSSRQKIDHLKNTLGSLREKALSTVQNPLVIQKLNVKFNELESLNKRSINEFEKDQRDLNMIETGTNVVKEAVDYSKANGVPLNETFTPEWIGRMARDIKQIAPEMLPAEAKILTFKILANNPDMLGNPSVMTELFNSEFSKGISFATLYRKGTVPNRSTGLIDEDAKQFKQVWDEYQTNSTAYFKSIEDNNKEAKKIRDEHLNDSLVKLYEKGGTGAQGRELAKSLGINDIEELNKIKTQGDKYAEGEKFDRFSPEGKAFEQSLAGVKTTPAEIRIAMVRNNISLSEKEYYEDLASIENTQIQQVTKVYDDSIKVVKAQRISLLKGALGGGNITLPNGEINTAALQQALLGKGLNQSDVHRILEEIQTLDLDYSNRVTKAASIAAKDDSFNIGQDVNQFQNDYNTAIAGFIDNIKQGILTRKEEGVKTSGGTGESGGKAKVEKEGPSIVKEHKDLIEDPVKFKEEQSKIIGENFKASTGEQAKQQLNKPVHTLSDEDAEYYSELLKNLPQEAVAQKFANSVANLPVVQERTLTGMDIFDIVTTGKTTEAPRRPKKESRTGLGTIVDDIDEVMGAIINWFKDKPQTKYEVESTKNYLDLFSGKSGTRDDDSIFTEDDEEPNVDVGSPIAGKVIEGDKLVADLPEETQADIKRQQEGRGVEHTEPSTAPIRFEEITKESNIQKRNNQLRSDKKEFDKQLNTTASEFKIKPEILTTIGAIESSSGSNVKPSSKGARGPMQIMPGTASGIARLAGPSYGFTKEGILNNDEMNMRAAAWLLSKELLPRYKGLKDQLKFALADYNSSPNIVKSARNKATDRNSFKDVYPHLPEETKKYIKKAESMGLF